MLIVTALAASAEPVMAPLMVYVGLTVGVNVNVQPAAATGDKTQLTVSLLYVPLTVTEAADVVIAQLYDAAVAVQLLVDTKSVIVTVGALAALAMVPVMV